MHTDLKPINKDASNHVLTNLEKLEKKTAEERLKFMDEDRYEEMITKWAYFCLKEDSNKKYEDVFRYGGSGDGGIDVIAFYDFKNQICDIYQCKHYKDSIGYSDINKELCKFLYNTFIDYIPFPKTYYLVAPQNITGPLGSLFNDHEKLRNRLWEDWEKSIKKKLAVNITNGENDKFKNHVGTFDRSIRKPLSPDKIIEGLRKEYWLYFQYLGIDRTLIPRAHAAPPSTVADYESTYINHLVDAYSDANKSSITQINLNDENMAMYKAHFTASREQFYLAESAAMIGKEICSGGNDEYSEIKDNIEEHVIDEYYSQYHTDGFEKVKAVTKSASQYQVEEMNSVKPIISSRVLKGMCFQLSNENKLIWVKKKIK